VHRLLQRQIKRYIKTPDSITEELQEFIKAVDNAYNEYDSDRLMLERAFDISSQELIELNEGLRNALNRFELIIENTPFIAIQGFDRHGAIIHWNHASTLIYGYTAEEVKGKRIQDIILAPETVYYFENILNRVWSTGNPNNPFECEVHNRNAEKRWVFASMFPILEDGKVTEVFCMALDVTDKKRLESQLLQAQKMEAIGTLAGGIAHDFNNLLMGIQGYTQIMLMGISPSHPHYDKLKRIEMQVKSGANLSNQLLGFARGGRYEVKPTNLNEVIEQTAHTFARTKKEVTVSLRLAEDLLAVEADRGQMEQVLLNLFVNAWQAMPGGGNLELITENVFLNESYTNLHQVPPGRYTRISVTDTGVGMDKKTLDRIFDPFFTTREMGRGTGLGLASVYGIIKAHRGIITVHSKLNHGATFNIYLPSCYKSPVQETSCSEEIQAGDGSVLVVDDETIILDVTIEMLKVLGYKVMTARSGKEAIELYKMHRDEIDLVILDMIMPGMSGEMTFDELQVLNPDIKVILASGYSLSESAKQILDKGAISFIQKPYKISDLSAKISDAMSVSSVTLGYNIPQ
jgi:two-component system, cell cycle sensor histidine kinase and response regulator CckA